MKPNILIRLAEKKDVKGIMDIYSYFILNSITSFETEIPSEKDFWDRIQKVLEEAPWLVCEVEGEIAGYAYGGKHRSRAAYSNNREVSVYINQRHRRNNIGSALYFYLFKILEKQGFTNLLAGIAFPNDPSIRFHESFGFQKVGVYHNIGYKNGRWVDVGWWELNLNKTNDPPVEIQHYKEIIKATELIETQQRALEKIKF